MLINGIKKAHFSLVSAKLEVGDLIMPAKFTSQATGSAKAPRGQGPATRPGLSSPESIRAESQGEACHRAGHPREMGLMLPRSSHLHPQETLRALNPSSRSGFIF